LGDEVYVGGDNLYRLESDTLATIETGLTGIVTVLYYDGPVLMVGTTHGLYARTEFGTVGLLDDIDVSAIVRDHDCLLVGTNGQGLFRYDGEDFVKRYLKRDPSLLDVITTLAFNHNHLYVGTPDAFFIYDGGRWQELTPDDGLPSGNVRSIDASGWVIYVATDRGVVSWFDGQLSPAAHLEQQPAELVRVDRQRLLIGTSSEGLLVRSGPVLKPLVNRLPRREPDIASLEH